jgi:stringent starvation protein B
MTSPRPYLIRGLYEWILDNGQTPYLLVNAEHENLVVPRQFVEEGRIVLSIRPEAVQNLGLGNSEVEFDARFGGKPMHVEVPVTAVLAIYARENGKGMAFEDDDCERSPSGNGSKKPKPSRPSLKVVK